jgi:hypothetical protein
LTSWSNFNATVAAVCQRSEVGGLPMCDDRSQRCVSPPGLGHAIVPPSEAKYQLPVGHIWNAILLRSPIPFRPFPAETWLSCSGKFLECVASCYRDDGCRRNHHTLQPEGPSKVETENVVAATSRGPAPLFRLEIILPRRAYVPAQTSP